MTCSSMVVAPDARWAGPNILRLGLEKKKKKKLSEAPPEQRELCFDTKRRQIMPRQTCWKSHFMKMTIMTAALIFIRYSV